MLSCEASQRMTLRNIRSKQSPLRQHVCVHIYPSQGIIVHCCCCCRCFTSGRHSICRVGGRWSRSSCREGVGIQIFMTCVLRSFWMQVDACVQTDNVDLKDLRLMVPEKVVAVEVDDKKQIIKYIPIEPRHYWDQKSGANPVFTVEPLVTTFSFAFLWHPRKKSWPLKRKCLLWRKLFEQ